MASVNENLFNLDQAQDEAIAILNTLGSTTSDYYKMMTRFRKLLTDINQSGYETGFKEAIELNLEESFNNKTNE